MKHEQHSSHSDNHCIDNVKNRIQIKNFIHVSPCRYALDYGDTVINSWVVDEASTEQLQTNINGKHILVKEDFKISKVASSRDGQVLPRVE